MNYNKETLKFWTGKNAKNHIIAPNSKTDFPEGEEIFSLLQSIVGKDSIIDMGCGRGRLTSAFSRGGYTGLDINLDLLRLAKKANPEYKFLKYKIGTHPGNAKWLMLYTVALHIDDMDIEPYLRLVTSGCDKIIIAEVTGKKFRKPNKPGKPPVFNRDNEDYIYLMNGLDFSLNMIFETPYHGIQNKFKVLVFRRVKL